MHLYRIATTLALIGVTTLAAGAQTAIPTLQTSAQAGEKAIVTYLVEDSVGDVQLGQLGLRKALAPSVRALARAMVADHTMTANDAMRVAQQMGVSDVQFKPESGNQVDLSHLARYSGATFDREYVQTLVDAHKSDIMAVRDALEFTVTPALRRSLATSLAVDRKHLRMAQRAQAAVGSPS